jgi:hypothetical protein
MLISIHPFKFTLTLNVLIPHIETECQQEHFILLEEMRKEDTGPHEMDTNC